MIRLENLSKEYDEVVAVQNLSLEIPEAVCRMFLSCW